MITDSKTQKLSKNVIVLLIGSISSKLLTFLLTPYYTSVLSEGEYGTIDLIITYINLLWPVMTLLMSEAIMRFALERTNDPKKVLISGLFINFLGMLLLVVISPLFILSNVVGPYLLYFVLYFSSYTLYILLSQYVKGINRTGLYAVTSIIVSIIIVALNILFISVMHLTVIGYILSSIIGFFIGILILLLSTKSTKFILSFKKKNIIYVKDMIKYSIPMIPNSISWWISNSAVKIILSIYFSTAVVGIFAAAYKIPSILAVISSTLISAWQISAVDDFGSNQSKTFYSTVYKIFFSVIAILCSFTIAFNDFISSIMFQGDFISAKELVPVLVLSFYFQALSTFYGTIYTSSKKTSGLFYSTLAGAIVNIVASFLLIPIYSSFGATISVFLGFITVYLYRLIDSKRILIFKSNPLIFIMNLCVLITQIVLLKLSIGQNQLLNYLLLVLILIINYKIIFLGIHGTRNFIVSKLRK